MNIRRRQVVQEQQAALSLTSPKDSQSAVHCAPAERPLPNAAHAVARSCQNWQDIDGALSAAASQQQPVPAVAVSQDSGAVPTWASGAAKGMRRASAQLHSKGLVAAATSSQLLPGGTLLPACVPTQGSQVCSSKLMPRHERLRSG
jgi:hypothetical protein